MKKYRKLLLITMLVCFGLALKGERVEAAEKLNNYFHVLDDKTHEPVDGITVTIYAPNGEKIGDYQSPEFTTKLDQLTNYTISISHPENAYTTNQAGFFSANKDYYGDTKDINIYVLNVKDPDIYLNFLVLDNVSQDEIKGSMEATIYSQDTNERIDTVKITKDNTVHKTKLRPGKYIAEFTKVPKGYMPQNINFEVKKSDLDVGITNINVTAELPRITGVIKIYVKNEEDKLLPGASFMINQKGKEESEETKAVTTDENGTCNYTVENVGDYENKLKSYYQFTIIGKEPPVGYQFEETEQTVSMEDGEIDDNHLLDVSVTFKVTKKPVIDESKVNQSTVMSGKDQQKLNNEATAEQNKKDTEETLSDQLSKLAKSVQTSDGNIKILFVAILVLACLGMIYGKKIIKEKKRG